MSNPNVPGTATVGALYPFFVESGNTGGHRPPLQLAAQKTLRH
jgi:hypothetical protein